MSRDKIKQLNITSNAIVKVRPQHCVSDAAMTGTRQKAPHHLTKTTTRGKSKLLKRNANHCSSSSQECCDSQWNASALGNQTFANIAVDHPVSHSERILEKTTDTCVNSHTFLDKEDQHCKLKSRLSVVESGQVHLSTKEKETGSQSSSSESVLQYALEKSMTSRAIMGETRTEKKILKTKKKKSKLPNKEKIRNKPARLKALVDRKTTSKSRPSKTFQCDRSPVQNHSRLLKPARTSSRKSYIEAMTSHESQKQMSMPLHSSWNKKSSAIPHFKKSNKIKSSPPHMSPARVGKISSNQERDVISVSISPQKLLYGSVNIPNVLPGQENYEVWMGHPHKCVGYQSLCQTEKQSRSCEYSEKPATLSVCATEQTKMALIKTQHSGNIAVGKQKFCSKCPKKHGIKKHNLNKTKSGSVKRNVRQAVSEGAYVLKRTCATAHRRMVPIKSVPYLSYPMQGIPQEDAAVFVFHAKNQIEKTQKVKAQAKRIPQEKPYSNMIPGRKQTPSVKFIDYRHTGQRVRYNPVFWAGDSQVQLSFTKSAAAPRCSRKSAPLSFTKRHKLSPTRIHRKKILMNNNVRRTVLKQKSNVGVVNAVTTKTRKHKKCQTFKKIKVGSNREFWIQTPVLNKQVIRPYPPTTVYQCKGRKRKRLDPDGIQNVPLFSTGLTSSEINKDISNFPKTGPSFCTGLNEPVDSSKNDTLSWDRYKTTEESVSSFYTEISSWSHNTNEKCLCSGSLEREHMGYVRGTIMLPSTTISCSQKKHNNHHKDMHDLANKCIHLSSITKSPSITPQSHSDSCSVSLIPSLLRFLSCINKTFSKPKIFQGSVTKSETPMANMQIELSTDPATSKNQIKNDLRYNVNEKSKTLSEDNASTTQSMLSITDEETTNISPKINRQEDVDVDDVKDKSEMIQPRLLTTSLGSQTDKALWTKKCEACKASVTADVKTDTSKLKAPVKMNSPTTVAKSILRTGHIVPATISFQNDIAKQQLGRMQRLMQEIYSEYTGEQCNTTLHPKIFTEGETDTGIFIFSFVFLTIIVQAMLYFSVPSD